MNFDDSPPTDPAQFAADDAEAFHDDVGTEENPPLMEEISAPAETGPPRRKSGGGLLSVLGLLFPVLLGGVTVFGLYFLFLHDWVHKAPDSAAKTTEDSPSKNNGETPPPTSAAVKPPESPLPAFDETSLPINASPNPPGPPEADPAQVAAEAQTKRQKAAAGKLRLAKKLLDKNPSAAVDWFRDVIKEFPGTPAAREAEAWLKEHGHGS